MSAAFHADQHKARQGQSIGLRTPVGPRVQRVRVDHRRSHALVPQQFLDGPDVVTVLEEEASIHAAVALSGELRLDTGFLLPLKVPFPGLNRCR